MLTRSSGLRFTDVRTVAATGSVIGNAAAIGGSVNIVTGADDTKGVLLPQAAAGKVLFLYSNEATAGLKVYPPVDSTINDGTANTAITIEGKSLALFLGTSGTNWSSMFTANA